MRVESFVAAGLVAMGVAACHVRHANEGTFRIVLDEEPVPVAVRALPSPQGHGDNAGSSVGSSTDNSTSGSSGSGNGGGSGGGGSGGGSAPAAPAGPVTGLTLVTEGRFDVAGLAGNATGGNAVGTSAATAAFRQINGVAAGAGGAVYVADPVNNQIRDVATGAAPSRIVAGLPDGLAGFTGDNLPAVAVRLNNPVGLAFDAHTGALVVADAGNRRIREFVPGARIYTHAGGGQDASDDVGVATDALLGRTTGVALDATGNVYFTERDTGRVRKVDVAGHLTTVATLAAGQVGPIAASAAGDRLWVGEGGAIRLLAPRTVPVLDPAPLANFPGASVTGLAADQAGTLYLARTAGGGARETFVQRLLLAASGQVQAGRGPETIGGTGADVVASAAAHVDAPATDARTQLLVNAGECSLGIDLAFANDPAVLSGILYAGNSFADPVTGPVWGQVLRLGPVSP